MSGAFQAFVIEMELTGGKAVVKELNEVKKSADGVYEKFNDITKQQPKVSQGFKNTAGNLANIYKLAKASVPVLIALAAVKFTMNFAKQAEDLLFMANSAGIAANKMQTLALASERAGGTRQGAAATVGNINQQLEAARMGNFAGTGLFQAAKMYGLKLTDNNGLLIQSADKILENVAKLFDTLKDPLKQIAVKNLLGIDDGTFRNLQKGYGGYMAALRQAEANRLFSPADEKQILKFQDTLRGVNQEFQKIGGQIAITLLPHLQAFLNILKKAEANKTVMDFITGFFETLFIGINGLAIALIKLGKGIKNNWDWIEKIGGSTNPFSENYLPKQVWEKLSKPFWGKVGDLTSGAASILATASGIGLNTATAGTLNNINSSRNVTFLQTNNFSGSDTPANIETATKTGMNTALADATSQR